MKENVSIVIPTWNGLPLLKRFLPSVVAAADRYTDRSGAEVEIIVADDGSTDATGEWLESISVGGHGEAPLRLRYVKNERNLGFSAACNQGAATARHPLILLLNNDV